jgi:pilus assembly protein CpaE
MSASFLQLSAIVVDADTENRQELHEALSGYGVNVSAGFGKISELQRELERSEPPQVVLINLDPSATSTLDEVESLPRKYPGAAFFAMSQVLDPQLLMRSMSAGVREFIPLPMPEAALRQALERVATSHGGERRGRVIHVVPTAGGCGSTTVACNIAASLANSGHRAVLLDLDLVRGDVGGAFDVRPKYTIADVMEQGDRLDQQLVDNALIEHEKTGLKLLGRPELMEESQRVTQAGVQRLIGVLARNFEYVVVDGQMSLDPIYATVVAASDMTILTMQLNVPSCRNAERYVAALRRMGVESSKVRVVANRYVKKGSDIDASEVERSLGLEIAWTIPNDFKTAIGAINYGEPAVSRSPRAEMSQSLLQIAREVTSGRGPVEAPPSPGDEKSRGGFFRRRAA